MFVTRERIMLTLYIRVGQVTDDNMTHAHYMLDT